VDFIHQVRISPDKSWLACYVKGSETIELRDLKTGTLARALKPEKQFGGGSLEHVTFSPRSDLIVAVENFSDIYGWDCKSGRQTFSFRAHEKEIVGQAFLPDGRLVTSGKDRMIKIWDLSTKTATKTIRLDEGRVEALVVSPDGKLAGSVQLPPLSDTERGGFAVIWDLEKGTKVSTMQEKYNFGPTLHFLPGNKFLVVGGWLDFVLWDVASGTKKAVLLDGRSRKLDEMIDDFDVTENGTVFILRRDGRLQRWAVKE
jgi:WD40 repeat protein